MTKPKVEPDRTVENIQRREPSGVEAPDGDLPSRRRSLCWVSPRQFPCMANVFQPSHHIRRYPVCILPRCLYAGVGSSRSPRPCVATKPRDFRPSRR